ncbi:hypothetical protein BJY01DRAFT_254675 [Aspergillus pseudoustus]|uniref:Uncharacterized protein n=1 Tax=Aspergillus pseudoustus TaxID=1810923 RepID=A0ABR4IRL2_9EURO
MRGPRVELASKQNVFMPPEDELILSILESILRETAQSAVDMGVQIPLLEFCTLEDLDARFSDTSDTVSAETYSFAIDDDGKCRLNVHRVLGIPQPYTFRTVNGPKHEKEVERVCKAVALTEEEKSVDIGEPGRA